MNFMFSWQEQYLTRSLRSLVRYCSCHSNIKFISSLHRVIFSISSTRLFVIAIEKVKKTKKITFWIAWTKPEIQIMKNKSIRAAFLSNTIRFIYWRFTPGFSAVMCLKGIYLNFFLFLQTTYTHSIFCSLNIYNRNNGCGFCNIGGLHKCSSGNLPPIQNGRHIERM